MKMWKRIGTAFCVLVLVISVFAGLSFTEATGDSDGEIVLIDEVDSLELDDGIEAIHEYPNSLLIEASEEQILELEGEYNVDRLERSTLLSVKGHEFDIEDGYPDFSEELMIDGYEEDEEGIYIVNTLGPIPTSWRTTLEEMDLDIINYVRNHAYEVRMTPETAEEVEELEFVDSVMIYQPGFKLAEDVEPGMVSVNFADGSREIIEVEDESRLKELARRPDVYYISNFQEPELHGEVATQNVGGGHWIWDPDEDPYVPWRGENDEYDYGAHANHLGYEGDGIEVAVGDTGILDHHPDFEDRAGDGMSYEPGEEWYEDEEGHGTHVAGSVGADTYAGTGDTVDEHFDTDVEDYLIAQGMAPESELFGQKIFNNAGEFVGPTDPYTDIIYDAREESDAYIHQNSWGSDARGAYEDACSDYDAGVRDAGDGDPMIISVSAGNEGEGPEYESTGSPGNAKNVITVGASEAFYPGLAEDTDGYEGDPERTAEFSSRGWTEDGRVKPDVMAPGMFTFSTYIDEDDPDDWSYAGLGGTSMSAPAVAGGAALVTEWYEDQFGEKPNPSMVRALMINTAHEMEPQDGDYYTGHIPNEDEGWGVVDLVSIMDAPVDFMLEDEETVLETDEEEEYEIQYQDEDEPLKISTVWTDAPAEPGDDPTLQNDLNLEVETPAGEVIRGNAFDLSDDGESDDGYTHPDAEVMEDFDGNEDGWDDRNNVQNVFIPSEDLESGTYTVTVSAEEVPEPVVDDGQDFSLVKYNVQDEESPDMEITRPEGGEIWNAGDNEDIEWSTTSGDGEITEVDLEYSTDDGDSWNTVAEGIDDVGSYTWEVPDEATDEARIRGTVHDDNQMTGTDISGQFTIEGTEPPEIEITTPSGGEEWNAGDEEEIEWTTTPGDGNIEEVDLEYSVDDGDTWEEIIEGTDDDGSYTWQIPDETSDEVRVRGTVYDDNDLSDADISPQFTLLGEPPAPPENLEVEYTGEDTVTIFEDDVSEDKGYETWVNEDGASEWDIRDHGSAVGDESWDWGDGEINKDEDQGFESRLISPEIEIPDDADEVEFTFEHWRDFGDTDLYDGGNLRISVDDGDFELVEPEEGYDGTIDDGFGNPLEGESGWGEEHGWETATFDLTEELGEDIDGSTIQLRWNAGTEAWDGFYGEGWRIDDIELTAELPDAGDEDHNLLTWDASPDDPETVDHYNIYRTEDEFGPWDDPIGDVGADGSAEYEYVDYDAAGEPYNWYVVRAVGEEGQEEGNEESEPEPDAEVEPGPLPPEDPEPEDGASGVNTDADLSVFVEHEEGESMDVEFFDAYDDSSLGTDGDVDSETRAEVTWTDLDYETEYDWYAVAEDDDGETAQSDEWSFTTTVEDETGAHELMGNFHESYDGEARYYDGDEHYGNISVVEYQDPANMAICDGTDGSSWVDPHGGFSWVADSGDNAWSEGPPALDNDIYFINEIPEEDVEGDAGYLWATVRDVDHDYVANPQESMMGQFEPIPTPEERTVGEDTIEIELESPAYTDWDNDEEVSPGMGTYDEFVSYSVFMRDEGEEDWSHMGETEEISEEEYDGEYDDPIVPWDDDNPNPEDATTGMNEFTADGLDPGVEYELKVRMNLGEGLEGGHEGGYDDAYTTWQSGGVLVAVTEDDDPPELEPPTGLEVEKDEDDGDIELDWDDVEAPEYNVYYSENQYDDLGEWDLIGTTSETTFVDEDELGGENYYYVTATDGEEESGMSRIVFSVEAQYEDDPDYSLHYTRVPVGLENHDPDEEEELRASDIVKSIEGSVDVEAEYIDNVVKWDYSEGGYDPTTYDYDDLLEEWPEVGGEEDFEIEPGDGIGIMVQDDADFSWHVTGYDAEVGMHFEDDPDYSLHYTSIPYTLKDFEGDGVLRASDVVSSIEGSVDVEAEYIDNVVKWDYSEGGYDPTTYSYDHVFDEWPEVGGEEDFEIEPGDGIGIMVQDDADFDWEPDLIAEEGDEPQSENDDEMILQFEQIDGDGLEYQAYSIMPNMESETKFIDRFRGRYS